MPQDDSRWGEQRSEHVRPAIHLSVMIPVLIYARDIPADVRVSLFRGPVSASLLIIVKIATIIF